MGSRLWAEEVDSNQTLPMTRTSHHAKTSQIARQFSVLWNPKSQRFFYFYFQEVVTCRAITRNSSGCDYVRTRLFSIQLWLPWTHKRFEVTVVIMAFIYNRSVLIENSPRFDKDWSEENSAWIGRWDETIRQFAQIPESAPRIIRVFVQKYFQLSGPWSGHKITFKDDY